MGWLETFEKLKTNAISELNISLDNKFAIEFAQALACNTSLQKLYLSRNKLTKKGIKVIARAVFEHAGIRTLVFSDCTFDQEFFDSYSPQCAITSLTLSRILLRSGLRRFVEINPSALQRLDLSENQIDADGIKNLIGFLESSHSLLTLGLANNVINNKGVELLTTYLQKNPSLISLNLAHNKIGNSGAKALANALKSNITLNFLDLSANQLGNKAAIAFAALLQTNSSLRLLNLDAAKPISRQTPKIIGDKGIITLVNALKGNVGLVALSINYQTLSPAAIEMLVELQKQQQFISLHIIPHRTNFRDTVILEELIEKNLSAIEKFLKAAFEENEDSLIYWLEQGINPLIAGSYDDKAKVCKGNYVNREMNTSLHYAAKNGWEKGVKLILAAIKANNLDPVVRNMYGETALDIAKEMAEKRPEKNYQEIIELLQGYQNHVASMPDLSTIEVPASISSPASLNSKNKEVKDEKESALIARKKSPSKFFLEEALTSSKRTQVKPCGKNELNNEFERYDMLIGKVDKLLNAYKKTTQKDEAYIDEVQLIVNKARRVLDKYPTSFKDDSKLELLKKSLMKARVELRILLINTQSNIQQKQTYPSTMEERVLVLEEKVKKITIEKKQLENQLFDMRAQINQLQEEMLHLLGKQPKQPPKEIKSTEEPLLDTAYHPKGNKGI